jgi:hypothetical protein
MAIFNSYVKLPEGIPQKISRFDEGIPEGNIWRNSLFFWPHWVGQKTQQVKTLKG